MKLITTQTVIEGVALRWHEQYKGNLDGTLHDGKSKQAIYDQLLALDTKTATPADVAKIIGNNSWTRIKCDECQNEVKAVVRLGEEPDYESQTAHVCVPCMTKAMALIKAL